MNKLNKSIRFVGRLLVFLVLLLLVLPLVVLGILLSKLLRLSVVNRYIMNAWGMLFCRCCGLKIKVFGELPKYPSFIVANHVSWLDIPIIHSITLAGFVAKNEIKYWPILGWLAVVGDSLFLQRGSQDSRRKVIEKIKQRLQQQRSVAVFPEGTVTDGSYLRRFHHQLFLAAVEAEVSVTPVAIKFLDAHGKRNANVGFIDNEWFVVHVWRIFSLPASSVEIHCGSALKAAELGQRAVTAQAENYVLNKLLENDYIASQNHAE